MKRIASLLALCILLVSVSNAQQTYNSSGGRSNAQKKKKEQKGFDPQKLIFGGGLSLGLGTVTTLGVSPIIGYRITDRVSAGIGMGYQYMRIKDYYASGYDYKASILYPSAWARCLVFRNFFVQAEFEHDFQTFNNYEFDPGGSGAVVTVKEKYDNNALLLGAGLRQPVTQNSSFVIMGLYDVIQDPNSPYLGQIDFRFGFNVGF